MSYPLKLPTALHDLEAFRALLLAHRPSLRGGTVLPIGPAKALGHEYLPEEEVAEARCNAIPAGIRDTALEEAIGLAHLRCARSACPP